MSQIECPSCGTKGKGVKPITLQHLLSAEGLSEVKNTEGFRHCPSPECEVAYYDLADGIQIPKSEVLVRIGTKETSGPRPVCYCFEHTWESIEQDIRTNGSTTVVEDITAHCKSGLDNCPQNNPQGSCCLGNVRRAVKEGYAAAGIDPPERPKKPASQEPVHDCCSASASLEVSGEPAAPQRATLNANGGTFAAVGAVFAAILSSACCWLPLLLIALGAGTSSVAGVFEEYRSILLGVTAVLLGGGFYYVYFRKEDCAPGSSCEVPRPRLKLFNKITLWFATAMVVGFAAFPNYIGSLLDDGGGPTIAEVTAVSAQSPIRTFAVEGMTCEGCSANIKLALSKVPGVKAAEVSFLDKNAEVALSDGTVTDATLIAAISSAGYKAKRSNAKPTKSER